MQKLNMKVNQLIAIIITILKLMIMSNDITLHIFKIFINLLDFHNLLETITTIIMLFIKLQQAH